MLYNPLAVEQTTTQSSIIQQTSGSTDDHAKLGILASQSTTRKYRQDLFLGFRDLCVVDKQLVNDSVLSPARAHSRDVGDHRLR